MRRTLKYFFYILIGFVFFAYSIQSLWKPGGNISSQNLLPVYITKAPANRSTETPLPDTCSNPKINPSSQQIINVAISQWGAFGYGSRLDSSPSDRQDIPAWLWEAFSSNKELADKLKNHVNAMPNLSENDPKAFDILAAYWSTVDGQSWPSIVKSRRASKSTNPWGRAWSATFISWVMCKSGVAATEFPRTAAHRDYVRLYARLNKTSVYRIPSLNPSDIKAGDIICRFRGIHGVDLDHPGWVEALSNSPMHCDIVVANTEKGGGYIGMIGGNLDDAVMFTATKHVELFDIEGSPLFLWLSLQGSNDIATLNKAFKK